MAHDLPKNDIPILILSVLAERPLHGYAIAREIERHSQNTLLLREGSLYPALRVLEQDGLIAGAWEIQPSGPARKVYSITEEGRAEVAQRAEKWRQYAQFMNTVLGRLGNAEPA